MNSKMVIRGITAVVCAGMAIHALGQAQSNAPATALRANSTLVIVDVVVTDAQQNQVHNLHASDFTLFENGKQQSLRVFEEHTAAARQPLPPMPKLGPDVFTNYSPAPAGGALTILLFDSLNTPMNAQPYLRDQVLKYLKNAQPGTPIAIFCLTTQLRLLQGFNTDPELLRSVLNSRRALAKSSPLLDNPMTGGDLDGPSLVDVATDVFGNSPDAAMMLANMEQFEAERQSFQLQLRAQYTLDAMNQLARYLSRLPGRKNLIWFSGSFPINILPDGDLKDPFGVVASSADEFRETTNLLSQSQVAVYPIDARGLMTNPSLDASVSGKGFTKNPNAFAKANAKFFQKTADENGTMEAMAEATGGRAFLNTNGLAQAVAQAIESGSNYYTLAYSPENQNWKGEYRKIKVELARQGMTLAYRKGYYADDPAAPAHHGDQAPASPNAPPAYDPIRTAMLHGAPDPTEIIFEALVQPVSGAEEPDAVKSNQPNPKLKGPFRRYSVRYIATPGDVDCPATPDGIHHCTLEFLSFVYDADGVLLNAQINSIKADLSADHYVAMSRGGLQYVQEISIPVRGESFLRIGMHDVTTDHVGAIEIHSSMLSKTPAQKQR